MDRIWISDFRALEPLYRLEHVKGLGQGNTAIHTHDFYEFVFFVSGSAQFQVAGQFYHLQPGCILLISPMEVHAGFLNQEHASCECLVVKIDKRFPARASSGATDLTLLFDPDSVWCSKFLQVPACRWDAFKDILLMLIHQCPNAVYGRDLMLESLLTMLLVALNREIQMLAPDSPSQDRSGQLVKGAVAYIDAHYSEDISLDSIASRFYVSKSYFSHEFKRVTSISVHQYLISKRLSAAIQLMESGLPPTKAYQSCGFKDYASFYRSFTALYQCSPKDFFALHAQDAAGNSLPEVRQD